MGADLPLRAWVQRNNSWMELQGIFKVLRAETIDQVLPLLRAVEAQTHAGHHAVGFISYEAAPAFDAHLRVHDGGTLAAFAIGTGLSPASEASPAVLPHFVWQQEWSAHEHAQAITEIKRRIANGETYQTNLTFRLEATAHGTTSDELLSLCRQQRRGHGAFLDLGDLAIASLSPELFFHRAGDVVTCRPMKGTAPRGRYPAEDRHQRNALHASAKDRAENLMIVDMIRNDLGRVAKTGSLRVESLFDIEQYSTVWQMTSTITASTDASLPDLFTALFPSASVTGAPKIKTMEIIRELERSPRGLYTGAMGWVGPGGDCSFNVAIRTLVLDRAASRVTYGTGSGIVWDSSAEAEYQECRQKTAVVTHPRAPVMLFETMRWEPARGFDHLDGHLERLLASAYYFEIPLSRDAACASLQLACQAWTKPRRVRLMVDAEGSPAVEDRDLPAAADASFRIRWAAGPVHTSNVMLYHKTTDRRVYDVAKASAPDVDDVLLWNERGEMTESTIANVAIFKDGAWWTPPIESGLLPGVMRATLLAEGKIGERVIHREEIGTDVPIALFNAVRGWWPAVWVA